MWLRAVTSTLCSTPFASEHDTLHVRRPTPRRYQFRVLFCSPQFDRPRQWVNSVFDLARC